MKKILSLLILSFLCSTSWAGTISIAPWVSNNDVTIDHLETQRTTIQDWANGNVEGGINIKAGSLVSQDFSISVSIVQFRNEAFNDFTFSGMLPVTDATLTSNISEGISYVNGVRIETAATAHTYTASKDTYVYIGVGGSFIFEEVANGASAPSTPANSLLLAKVVTSGTAITSVEDLRTLSIQITSNSSNQAADYRSQGFIIRDSTTAMHAEPGQIAIGGSFYTTTADGSSLTTSTAANWIEGTAPTLNNLKFYVYAYNNSGTSWAIKYASADPVYSDTSSNTGGTLRYYTTGGTTYRALAWVSADSSGNVQTYNFSNFPDGGIRNRIFYSTGAVATGTATAARDDSAPQRSETNEFLTVPFKPTNANSRIIVKVVPVITSSGANIILGTLHRDSTADAIGVAESSNGSGGEAAPVAFTTIYTPGNTNLIVFRAGGTSTVGTMTLNGSGGARLYGGVMASSIEVYEE